MTTINKITFCLILLLAGCSENPSKKALACLDGKWKSDSSFDCIFELDINAETQTYTETTIDTRFKQPDRKRSSTFKVLSDSTIQFVTTEISIFKCDGNTLRFESLDKGLKKDILTLYLKEFKRFANTNDLLKIKLIETDDFHNDIVFEIKSLNVLSKFDSYYFLLDKKLSTQNESYAKVADVLIALLEGWVSRINALKTGEIVFLPIDFSDQYIGCLRIAKSDNHHLNLSYGFTEKIHGYEITPSAIESFVITDADFEKNSSDENIDIQSLIRSIEESTTLLKKGV